MAHNTRNQEGFVVNLPQELINSGLVAFGGLLAVINAVLGWLARQLWDAVSELRSDLAKLREELPKTYSTKTDFDRAVESLGNRMDAGFARLFDRLDTKADKH